MPQLYSLLTVDNHHLFSSGLKKINPSTQFIFIVVIYDDLSSLFLSIVHWKLDVCFIF